MRKIFSFIYKIMPGMNRGDNLEEIYAWIDELPFSKQKKNISRDFSDGVLMAELLEIYYPRICDAHNYISSSNIAGKKENWNTLNRKVFTKLDMKLSKDFINQLANSQQGMIEKLLIDLRYKINSIKQVSNSTLNLSINIDSNVENNENKIAENNDEIIENIENSNSVGKIKISKTNIITKFFHWLISWILVFSWPVKKSNPIIKNCSSIEMTKEKEIEIEKENNNNNNNEDGSESTISQLDFLLLKQEVMEKNFAITKLNRKLSCLESIMKMKDRKIGNLTAQISETSQTLNFKPHIIRSSILSS